MSDQVSQEFNTTFVGAGGGVASVNAQVGPAITLSAGLGVTVGLAGANNISVTNTGVLSVNINGGAARTGALSLLNGTNVTLVEGPIGTFTVNSVAGGGTITSINAQAGPAVTFNMGTSAAGSGTFTAAANIVSLNLTTFAGPGTPGIVVAPAGTASDYLTRGGPFGTTYTSATVGLVPNPIANNNSAFLTRNLGWFNGGTIAPATAGAGTAVPNAITTILITFTVPAGGGPANYVLTVWQSINGIAAQICDFLVFVNGVLVGTASFNGLVETAAQTLSASITLALALNVGDIVTGRVNHHGGGAATTSAGAAITGVIISAF